MPMQHLGNDRWQATILPDRIGRYRFTIEARWDKYGTFCRELEIKFKAGADVGVEIMEGRQLLEQAKEPMRSDESKIISSALDWLADKSRDAAAGGAADHVFHVLRAANLATGIFEAKRAAIAETRCDVPPLLQQRRKRFSPPHISRN